MHTLCPFHTPGVFVWDRERYPRLAVEDGRMPELARRAADDGMRDESLANLWAECWPGDTIGN